MEINKFNNKYRIESVRMKEFDYSLDGSYFVTICVKNRKYVFGDVVDAKMELGELGKIAEKYWKEISAHYPFVFLDEFVVMPNHLHGIIIINKTWEKIKEQRAAMEGGKLEKKIVSNDGNEAMPYDRRNEVISHNCGNEVIPHRCRDEAVPHRCRDEAVPHRCRDEAVPRLYRGEYPRMSEISPKAGSLSVIIGSYKSAVSKITHRFYPDFQWQARFHDRIIRNEIEYGKLKKYILENPGRWELEKDGFEKLYF